MLIYLNSSIEKHSFLSTENAAGAEVQQVYHRAHWVLFIRFKIQSFWFCGIVLLINFW